MRKVARMLLCILLTTMLLSIACAANVTGENVTAYVGERIRIPVSITQNDGIMGFRVIVEYPEELLCQPSVKAGSLTKNGLLDSNTMQAGRIEVLWCGSSDVMGDGSVFVLEFTVQEGAQGKEGELLFFYEQEDTFNELWNDVVLQFAPVCVQISEDIPLNAEDADQSVIDEENSTEPEEDVHTTDTSATDAGSSAEPEEDVQTTDAPAVNEQGTSGLEDNTQVTDDKSAEILPSSEKKETSAPELQDVGETDSSVTFDNQSAEQSPEPVAVEKTRMSQATVFIIIAVVAILSGICMITLLKKRRK